ncbi:tape measure protein [Pseudomonas capsici]|uniref:tape measure protein n=1 Tax=Pseudomonas capsici TaxID=2810614 RepID=UPI0021F1FD32|nr:tape measure protein [Pseudomonas capsici]MCV4287001.1 tape measure protein [Pseudomonas capsici]
MASRSLGTLTLDLIAKIGGFQQGMDQASRSIARTGSAADVAAARVTSMQGSFLSLSGAASTLSASLASAFSLHSLYSAAEAYTTLTSRMLLVTEGSAQLASAQKAVFSIAQSSYQPLTATAELYQRIATNQKELKLTGEGVAGIVGTISKTMAISGASAASANAALIQLGQAFASGVLRGEELNSVMEQAPALAQAIAAGMGRTVGELRTLGAAGMLTADSVVKALQSQEKAVNDLFNKTAVTIGNSLTAAENSFTQFVGRMDQASGVSAKISSNIVALTKSLDALTSDSASAAKTVEQFSSAAETLAYVFGARLALSAGQVAMGVAAATGASIKQTAALIAGTAAQWSSVAAESASAKQALATAQSRQADAFALMERAKVEVLTAEQKVAADRLRQQSEINNLKSVQAVLTAEVGLEQQRLRAQITEQGRALAIGRMAAARLDEAAIIKQIQVAEAQLAATTVATSAEIQAAYAARTAAVLAYGETTLAVNAAVRTSETATAAASTASKAILLTAAAGRGLLSLLTGPIGLIATTALVAASFFSFGNRAYEATKSLSAHGATVEEVAQKYEKLNGAQQRVKRLDWIDEQQEALKTASSALDDYTYKIERSVNLGPQASQFRTMIEEVGRGQRTLDSVTSWLESQVNLYPAFRKEIAGLTQDYDSNVQKAEQLKAVLGGLDGEAKKVARSSEQMRAALSASQEQSRAQIAKWDEYIGKLRETRDLFGANKKAQAEFEASKMGLNDKQREEARLVASQIDVMDKYKDAVKGGDKAKQESLRKELEAIYARQQALEDAAAAEKKLQDAANKAAEESANKKITEMRRVLEAANKVFNAAAGLSSNSSFLTGRNMLLVQPGQQSIVGRSMMSKNSPAPTAGTVPRKTPQQLAAERLSQIEDSAEPNKSAAEKAEKALTKRFSDMEEGYQRQIELINTTTDKRKNATEVEKLAFEVSAGKLEGLNEQQRNRLEILAADLDALKKAKTAEEDRAKASEAYRGLLQELRTPSEQANAQLRDRVKILNEAKVSGQDYADSMRRISEATVTKAPQFGGLDSAVNGPAGELVKIVEAQKELDKWREEELGRQKDYLNQKLLNEQQYAENVYQIMRQNNDRQQTLQASWQAATLGTFASVTGDASAMLKEMGGESSAIYKVMFVASKAASIAQAVVNTELAAVRALAELGPIAGPPMAATVRGLGYASVGIMSATTLAGMAHNGMDNIPKEGTWLLDGGERVLNPNQNRDLTQYLRNANTSTGTGGAPNISISAPISVQAQPGMSDEAARRQGDMMGEGLRQTIRQVVNEEFSQGGSMWRR